MHLSSIPQELQPIVTDPLDQLGRERVAHLGRDLTWDSLDRASRPTWVLVGRRAADQQVRNVARPAPLGLWA
jgi:hypothetical protein